MKFIVLLTVACATAIAAPEGYRHKEPAPVVEHGNLNGFQPIGGFPCTHASHHDSVGAATAAALIQSQSTGRIVNHHHQDAHLEAAASGIHAQTQAVTVNSHIVVGDNGVAASGASQEFQPGQGYVQGAVQTSATNVFQQQLPAQQSSAPQFNPQPSTPQFNPLPQLPPQLPAQPFNPAHLVPGKVVPSQVLSGQTQGYSYSQGSAASSASSSASSQGSQQHLHLHYSVPSQGAIVNGIGKVPPPPAHALSGSSQNFHYASGSNKFSGPPQTSYGAPVRGPAVFGGPAPYRPAGPVSPGPIGNIGAPRPVQHFGGGGSVSGGSFQHGSSSSYAGSFGHNTHNAQFVQSGSQFAGGAGHFGATGAGSQFGAGHSGAHAAGNFGSASSSGNFGSASSSHGGSFSSSNNLFNAVSSANGVLSGQLGHVIRETFANAPLDPTVEKHIYVHVPPEDLEENGAKHAAATILPQAPPKKHYKIIFIKAPTVAQPNYAQLAAAAAPQTEEKTLVYVLVKKPDEPSLEEIQQIQQAAVKPSKPEVYFIKYKTRKEGEQQASSSSFQQQQQQQFQAGGDQFGALNQFSNVGGYSSGSGSGAGTLDAAIDLRLGSGSESSSVVSTSSSYSSAATASSSASSVGLNHGESEGPKHELYGVPLE